MHGALVTGLACAVAIAAFTPPLTGCVVETSPATPTGSGMAVSGPPPPPLAEVRPPPPNAHVLWVPGYWHWSGLRYNWIPGHWENAPPGASWRAPRYSLRDGTYFYEPGSWMRP